MEHEIILAGLTLHPKKCFLKFTCTRTQIKTTFEYNTHIPLHTKSTGLCCYYVQNYLLFQLQCQELPVRNYNHRWHKPTLVLLT